VELLSPPAVILAFSVGLVLFGWLLLTRSQGLARQKRRSVGAVIVHAATNSPTP
jgi:hypothetical protein